MLTTFEIDEGSTPLLISLPHVGTGVPDEIAGRLTPEALALPDTDWHVDRLYEFADELGAWILRPQCSRYVVDLNRPSDGSLLYPGLRETAVCPTTTFNGLPLYAEGGGPDEQEIAKRISTYWKPYHATLENTLAALRVRYGYALLWDAHSIRSEVPLLFEGRLPDFNLGIGSGTCPPEVAEQLLAVAQNARNRSAVLNGRFKGGFITRRYGIPEANVWAVQLELSQRAYMDEDRADLGLTNEAEATQHTIREMLATYLELGRKTLRK